MAVGAWLAHNEQWHGLGGQVVPFGGNAHPGYLPGWGNPVWEDTFDGPNIDTNKWVVRTNATHGQLPYDWGYIRPENATIVDGMLRQRVSRRVTPITAEGRTRHWDTAYMDTIGKFTQMYGRWEMRAKLPSTANNSQGVWPAFWLRNSSSGEIDIMESWGDPTRNRARDIRHTDTSAWALFLNTMNADDGKASKTHEHRAFGWPTTPTPGNTAQGFHTWAVEYTPNYLRLYFDSIMTADIRPDGDHHPLASPAERNQDLSWVFGPTFTSPWNIRLNIQFGDNYWSSDDGNGVLSADMPADYLVDYVRAWEYTP